MPYSRPYASGFVDYPSTTTPINSTALNTMDVGIKTANDQFQTVTTAQRTALVPTVGQCVWDSDLRQLMVFMNASGGNAWQPIGNRLVCASTTRPATPFEGQEIYETDTQKTYVYTGSTWLETGDLDNTGGLSDATYNSIKRIGYTTNTSNTITVNQTSVAAASNLFSSSITFTADGTSAYRVEFFCPDCQTGVSASSALVYFSLVTGAGADLAVIATVRGYTGAADIPVHCVYYYTPAAGSTTLNVRAYNTYATGTLVAGPGGAGARPPMFLAVFGPDIT